MDDDFKTEKAVYTPEDFELWQGGGILEITPKFQRRSVWRTPARSFFIDTLLRGMTVPPIYLRKTQNADKTKTVREVVDGQQRIRSVLEYISDGYRLSKTLNAPWAGTRFSRLSGEHQQKIKHAKFSCETFDGISDQQVLEVFSRLNSHGVPLNDQELRNGKYFGIFKQVSYALALEYLEFWRTHRLFTELGIARMLEVELASELLIAGQAGMQDKKKTIDDFYSKWEENFPNQERDEKRFRETMSTLSETFGDESLANTEFRRPPMFYTLFCVVYHHLHGLPGVPRATPKKRLTADDRESLREAVIHLSDIIIQAKDPASTTPKKYQAFLLYSSRQTDNIKPRMTRFNTLFEAAF